MRTIKIIIEKTADYYDAYAKNCEGIYGAGATTDEAKQNVLEGLKLFVESRQKEALPKILQGEYKVTYQYDIMSFLNYFNRFLTNVAMERLTGINQKLLHQYSTGLKKPRAAQLKRIETAMHNFGNELLSVKL